MLYVDSKIPPPPQKKEYTCTRENEILSKFLCKLPLLLLFILCNNMLFLLCIAKVADVANSNKLM